MDPLTAGIMAGGNMLTAGFAGGDGYNPGQERLHTRFVDPYQGALFQDQMKRALSGGGDFGFGSAAKSGMSQLQQAMADRGIAPQSGVALAAQGNMLSNAMAQDVANRRSYVSSLLNTAPIKETSREGWDDAYEYGRWGEWQATNAPESRADRPYWGSAENYFGNKG